MGKLLDKVNFPNDIKNLSVADLNELCFEIRELLINSMSKTGGHLASNLGVVELTVALHKIFDLPKDSIVWDVGHQAYVHKILTGRKDRLHTLRQLNGLSGFVNPKESEYDSFIGGHSSTSISAAFGIAKANSILKNDSRTIAVIGDGALTGGMAYEALNNAGRNKENLIIILNDNEMSISKNVGAMAKYLSKLRSKPFYFRIKDATFNLLKVIPFFGLKLIRLILASKLALKEFFYHTTMFEEMGFAYLGPADGNDIKTVLELLERAKELKVPVVVHINTVKGKGYTHAEKAPDSYHGVSEFDIFTGEPIESSNSFSKEFGLELCKIAEKDDRICAVTAAMTAGTGLCGFSKQFSKRFFDVGIAEQHAVTFAAGLAKKGLIPVFSVYSSFLQRAYDQIIHDVALQNLKVIFAIDRAGIVGEDGETHQGIFDISFLNTIPNVSVLCPSNYEELRAMLSTAIYEIDGPVAIRYPRGNEENMSIAYQNVGSKILVLSYGRLYFNVLSAVNSLKDENINCDILKLNKIKPIEDDITQTIKGYEKVFIFEESIENGSVGEVISKKIINKNICIYHKAIKDFVPHGKTEELLKICGLDEKSIKELIMRECKG